MNDVKKAKAYSIMADETADISGKEQLSLGLRFLYESQEKVHEEIMGFVELKAQDAQSIAEDNRDLYFAAKPSPRKLCSVGFRWVLYDGRKRRRRAGDFEKKIQESFVFSLFQPQVQLGC